MCDLSTEVDQSLICNMSLSVLYLSNFRLIELYPQRIDVLRLIGEIDRSPRKNVASFASVEAAVDRTARTKMMTILFYRVSPQSQSYADTAKRGFSPISRYPWRGYESFVFGTKFSSLREPRTIYKRQRESKREEKKRFTLNATALA